jgi:hypothetical protein
MTTSILTIYQADEMLEVQGQGRKTFLHLEAENLPLVVPLCPKALLQRDKPLTLGSSAANIPELVLARQFLWHLNIDDKPAKSSKSAGHKAIYSRV